jgi:uncharacterized RDD family membrane protein YckC
VTVGRATPGIGRRLLCLVYEALLLAAVVLLAGGLAAALAQFAGPAHTRPVTRTLVVIACAGYFTWQWHRGGQTLPMKTWRIRLETAAGEPVSIPRALLRLVLSAIGYSLFGVSVWWAIIDRDRQFLHDRLAGTRLVIAG